MGAGRGRGENKRGKGREYHGVISDTLRSLDPVKKQRLECTVSPTHRGGLTSLAAAYKIGAGYLLIITPNPNLFLPLPLSPPKKNKGEKKKDTSITGPEVLKHFS